LRAFYLSSEAGYIDADDIALVEPAWEISDTLVSSYGWVIALKRGQRLYVEYTLDDSAPGLPEELEVVELADAETYPALETETGVTCYRPNHINAHLGITPPALH
jgi:hypothetical protein